MVRKDERKTDRHINHMGEYARRFDAVMKGQPSLPITVAEASPSV